MLVFRRMCGRVCNCPDYQIKINTDKYAKDGRNFKMIDIIFVLINN